MCPKINFRDKVSRMPSQRDSSAQRTVSSHWPWQPDPRNPMTETEKFTSQKVKLAEQSFCFV